MSNVVFSLVCCAVSAPSEGIAVIRRKNYLLDGFCPFERRVPKVTGESFSVDNLNDEHFSDSVKQKIMYRPSFFYNFFINQYQSKRNNYCSVMDSVIEKTKKQSGSSVELPYRKRNILWTQKALQSLKTLNPKTECPPTTTLNPIHKYNLNQKEKKGLFALKKIKKYKEKPAKQCSCKRKSVCKLRNGKQQVYFSGPLRRGTLNGYFEERMRHSQSSPCFHKPDSRIEFKNRDTYVDSVVKSTAQNRKSSAKQASQISYSSPSFRHSSSLVSNRRVESFRPADADKLKMRGNPPSDFEKTGDFLRPDFNKKFVQEHKTKRLHENFNSVEGSEEFPTSYATNKKRILAYTKTKIPIVDFDFPDYDELPLKDYAPVRIHRRRTFKILRSGLSEKRHPKFRRHLRRDLWHNVPVELKGSHRLGKIRRKKKCSKTFDGCEGPQKCWKSAPLLCIPYIRQGQDDLLKYLIRIMQKLLKKPYPQKIDVFENTKFKPCIIKHNPGSCEDIIPHEPEEENDDKSKTTERPCDPCSGLGTAISTLAPYPPSNCKSCSKNSSEPVCPSFPFSLPYLNQIYTEPTPCLSDKCFSTLPSFMLPSETEKLTKKPEVSSFSTLTKSPVTTAKSENPTSRSSNNYNLVSKNNSNINEAKDLNLNLFDNSYQVNDKMLPPLNKLKKERKGLNLTRNMSQSAVTLNSKSPLHKLSKTYDDGPKINNVTDIHQESTVASQRHDESQIGKPPFLSRQRASGSVKYRKRQLSRRHKREDDNHADDFVNYDGSDEYAERIHDDYEPFYQSNRKEINSDVNGFADDYTWTTLNFQMFSELAKLVARTEESTSDMKLVPTTPEPKATVAESSITENYSETSSVAASTQKSSDSNFSNEPSTDSVVTETQECETVTKSTQNKTEKETSDVKTSSTVGSRVEENRKEDKRVDLDSSVPEDGEIPTTLKTASIVRGPKRKMTKPSPKMYAKVYPDSVASDSKGNASTVLPVTEVSPKRSVLSKTTPVMTTVSTDVRLQLLAVCEGYLEVVKFMKSQNKSLGEDLDSDLYRYCENIISQSFSQQTESSKPKKSERGYSGTGEDEDIENIDSVSELVTYDTLRLDDPVLKRELEENEEPQNEKLITTTGKNSADDDEFLKKGMTKGQVELLNLLKKKEQTLLNWLLNSKEGQKQSETAEADYDDVDVALKYSSGNRSDTIRPRGAKSSRTTAKVDPSLKENSGFPVYAKQYGYDKGGQLKQVEVLWRKVDEKTHEKKIFKNMSVLALVLTSTTASGVDEEDNNIVNSDESFNEDTFETKPKNDIPFGLAAEESQGSNDGSKTKTEATAKTSSNTEKTVIYVYKPDPSSLIGSDMVDNTTEKANHPNLTQKIGDKINKAEEVVEKYTVEFWNYAAYIIPITFTILFLFCCACIVVRSLKKRKKKKKKKKPESTDEETTEDTEDSVEAKKPPDKKRKSKKIWNAWKKNSDKNGSEDETKPPEKKRSLLRFIKGRKNDKSEAGTSVSYTAIPESEKPKEDTENEAAERRELISLLEELKKIEMENVGEKKEQKSVHVQYMIQDSDEAAFKRSGMQKSHPLYDRNFPFYERGADDYGIYTDTELHELLPCECGLYSKKRDCLRKCNFRIKEGRCDGLFNVFRNTNVCHHELANAKKFPEKERNFLFDKYRSTDANDDTNEMSFTEEARETPPFNPRNPNDWIGEVEHFNREILKKKHVRLKDDGVLCRL